MWVKKILKKYWNCTHNDLVLAKKRSQITKKCPKDLNPGPWHPEKKGMPLSHRACRDGWVAYPPYNMFFFYVGPSTTRTVGVCGVFPGYGIAYPENAQQGDMGGELFMFLNFFHFWQITMRRCTIIIKDTSYDKKHEKILKSAKKKK